MSAPILIPTTLAKIDASLHTCQGCDVCGSLGCLDSHGLCDAVNPEQTAGCFREPLHDGLHTFEIGRAVTQEPEGREP
jgi:hypothetical protein